MKNFSNIRVLITTKLILILLLPSFSMAEDLFVSHSYVTENVIFNNASMLAPDSQDSGRPSYSGYYQGQFILNKIKEYPRVNCRAIENYNAEFTIEQKGQSLYLRTPGGAVLSGRAKRRGKFRVKANILDGQLERTVIIRGRVGRRGEARVTNIERISVMGIKACKIIYKSKMARFYK